MRKIIPFAAFVYKDFKFRILLSLICKFILNFTKGLSLLVLIPIISESQDIENTDKINQFFHAAFEKLGYAASINTFVITILCLALFQFLLNYYVFMLDVKLVEEFNFKLKSELNHNLLYADYLFYKKRKNAKINTVILNQIELLGFALNQFVLFFSKLINLIVYLAFAAFISFKITLLVLFLLTVIFVLHKLIFKSSYQIGKQEYHVKEEEFTQLNDQISSIKEIKLKNKEFYFSQKLNHIFKNYFVAQIRFMKLQNQSNLIFELSSFFIFLGVFFFFKLNFYTNISEWIVLIYLLSRSLPLGSSISNSFMNIINVLPSFLEFTNLKQEINENTSKMNKLI
jgi:ABC-type multidrug transport system fused ATPase/permease subunit